MKVLLWSGSNGSFCAKDTDQPHPIRDISEQDVLTIMRLILDGSEPIEMDPLPTDCKNVDQAALVIYEELLKQFTTMITKRENIINSIDKKFETARSYYSQEDVSNLFDAPSTAEEDSF